MRSKEQAFILAVMVSLILGLYLGRWYTTKSSPECYITTVACGDGYDSIGWSGGYWEKTFEDQYGEFSLGLVQCCRAPHYLLQGIEPTLYVMKNFCQEVDAMDYVEVIN